MDAGADAALTVDDRKGPGADDFRHDSPVEERDACDSRGGV